MKTYNCPDCNINTNSCSGCLRTKNIVSNTSEENIDFDWSKLKINSYGNIDDIPESCKHCATHPSNGGDGICWCVLGTKTIY